MAFKVTSFPSYDEAVFPEALNEFKYQIPG
jgi:hypothetical protein